MRERPRSRVDAVVELDQRHNAERQAFFTAEERAAAFQLASRRLAEALTRQSPDATSPSLRVRSALAQFNAVERHDLTVTAALLDDTEMRSQPCP